MKHNLSEFENDLKELKLFLKEQDKLEKVARVISPSGTNVCEFGNRFVDAYINIMSDKYNDEDDWISWFIFENEFGEKGFEVVKEGKEIVITDEKAFFNTIIADL